MATFTAEQIAEQGLNPAKLAMESIVGTPTVTGTPIADQSTPKTTAELGQSTGEVFDPYADVNAQLAALKESNSAMAKSLGLDGTSTDTADANPLTGKAFTPGEEKMWPVSTAQGGSADLPDWFRQQREWQEYWQKSPNGWIQLERSQMTPSILAARKEGPDAIIAFGRGTGPAADQRIGYLSAAKDWEAANPGQTAPVNAYTGDAAAGKAQAIAAEAASRQQNTGRRY